MEIDESKLFCPIAPVFLEWEGGSKDVRDSDDRKVKRDVKIKDVNSNIRLKTLITIEVQQERRWDGDINTAGMELVCLR
jgi:hypothetical protein